MRILILTLFASSFLPISTNLVFGEWHSWDEEKPKENQLYKYVQVFPGAQVSLRQIFYITHYDKNKTPYIDKDNGWWDVTKEELWKWFGEGNTIIYNP